MGTAALSLGHAFMKGNEVVAIARPLMQALAEYTSSAVMLAAADGHRERMVLLEVCQGDDTFRMNLAPGARVPHGSTALGRADLASRPPELFERYLARLKDECEPGYWPRAARRHRRGAPRLRKLRLLLFAGRLEPRGIRHRRADDFRRPQPRAGLQLQRPGIDDDRGKLDQRHRAASGRPARRRFPKHGRPLLSDTPIPRRGTP